MGGMPRTPCRFYLEGRCAKGPDCPFLHAEGMTLEGSGQDPVCWSWVTYGRCRVGDACKYQHKKPPDYDVNQAADAINKRVGAENLAKNIPRGSLIPTAASKLKRVKEEAERQEEERKKREKDAPNISQWARLWREAFQS